MAIVRFQSAIDFGNYNYAGWFNLQPTVHTSSQMVYVNGTQAVTFDGHDLAYSNPGGGAIFIPNNGFITDITGVVDGAELFSIEGISGTGGTGASVVAIRNAAIGGNEDAITNEFFGGKDAIYGSDGDDKLYGFGGNDKMRGGRGADTVNGGAGTDHLYGGKGADTFHFDSIDDTSKKHPDVIMDLENNDKFDLTDMTGASLAGITSSYDAQKDVTKFSFDTNGDHKADAYVLAQGDHTDYTIDSSHFLIV